MDVHKSARLTLHGRVITERADAAGRSPAHGGQMASARPARGGAGVTDRSSGRPRRRRALGLSAISFGGEVHAVCFPIAGLSSQRGAHRSRVRLSACGLKKRQKPISLHQRCWWCHSSGLAAGLITTEWRHQAAAFARICFSLSFLETVPASSARQALPESPAAWARACFPR